MFDIKELCSTDNVLEITDRAQWNWWTKRQRETCVQKQTKCIPLRFTYNNEFFGNSFNTEDIEEFPAYEIYKPYIDEYLDLLSDHYEWTEYLAILTRLEPHGVISEHRDGGLWLKQAHRIHLPIVTNPDVLFRCGDTTMNMKRGVFYEMNNTNVHAVHNDSHQERIHLIIDLHNDKESY